MQKRLLITLFTTVVGTTAASQLTHAAQTPDHLHEYQGLDTAFGEGARVQPRTSWNVPQTQQNQWSQFLQRHGTKWRAMWDTDKNIPLRIYGQGIQFKSANKDGQLAQSAALGLLRDHLQLFAPGASLENFELVTNQEDDGIRSVGFIQKFEGKEVVGGTFSVRFKNDRLFVIASTVLPKVVIEREVIKTNQNEAIYAAKEWIRKDLGSVVELRKVEGEVILPIIRESGSIDYHHVFKIVLDAKKPLGRWNVFVDRRSGELVAREQTLMFQTAPTASALIKYNVPERFPRSTRYDAPASEVGILIGGQAVSTDKSGVLALTDSSTITVQTTVVGPYVRVRNDAGQEISVQASVAPGRTVVIDRRDDEFEDAQLTTFIASGIAKEKARSFAPNMRYLNEQLRATVNIDGECNAYSDGTTINFFPASRRCENTGRLSDVVYHEFGHAVHANSVIRGVGEFDRALSEGAADFLSATITGDPAMGRGFFYSQQPLRHIDPSGGEARWPDDIDNDVHVTGLIFAGALWDLRKKLITTLGEEEASRTVEALYYQAMRRSTDIPSSYAEVLAADDDDGDLSNGTPNFCDINDAFALHGLADPQTAGIGFDIPQLDAFNVLVPVSSGVDCPSSKIESAKLNWYLRRDENIRGEVEMTQGTNGLEAILPKQDAGNVIQFKITVTLGNGEDVYFPRNPAAPEYETFVGDVVPLYCTDFELDPELDGWEHELLRGDARRPGSDDWQWGTPAGVQGSGDPSRAYSGRRVIGNDLGGEINGQNYNGSYRSNITNLMRSPRIGTQGYTNIRVQYRRWLNVEDGFFDRASILANNEVAWSNLDTGNNGDTHHTDREWRFHDVDVSEYVVDDNVDIAFQLESDQGLNMGGWTIDDFCVVAFVEPVCGDGRVDVGETCDDGNQIDNDICSNQCETNGADVLCGNGTLDENEVCDWGLSPDSCSKECIQITAAGGTETNDSNSLARAESGGCGCNNLPLGTSNTSLGSLMILMVLGAFISLRKKAAVTRSKD